MNVVKEPGGRQMATRGRRRGRGGGRGSGVEGNKAEAVVNLGASSGGMAAIRTIVVDDEDDDVLESSPRSFAEAKSNLLRLEPSRRITRHSVVQVQDDPLELRLGLGGSSALRIRSSAECAEALRWARHNRPTVDLTSPVTDREDCVVLSTNFQNRKRPCLVLPAEKPKEKQVKLTCAICMDNMKQETSTVCGHIFCQACVQGAIMAQKKCPTCRRKLSMKDIHRIYIQSSTD